MELRKYIREMVETELNEFARISTNIKIGDAQKAAAAKKLLSGTWLEDMLDIVMAAGEVGIPQPDLARKLGKTSQQAINPKVNSFLDSGVFAKGELSVPKKEKSTSNSGMLGRPTSEKVLVAKALNSKFEADSDYEPSEDELEMLGSEFIEKLRMRVMGTLKRGRKLGASTAKDGMMAALKNVMNTSDEDGDGDVDNEDLDLVNENESSDLEKLNFIRQTLKNKGYNLPKELMDDMAENATSGDLFDPMYASIDTAQDAIDLVNEYISAIIDNGGELLALNSDYILPNNVKSIEDFKTSLNESFNRMQRLAGIITEAQYKAKKKTLNEENQSLSPKLLAFVDGSDRQTLNAYKELGFKIKSAEGKYLAELDFKGYDWAAILAILEDCEDMDVKPSMMWNNKKYDFAKAMELADEKAADDSYGDTGAGTKLN